VILAIETSCDETCAAVVEGARVRSSVVSSQALLHRRFGGVVPEIASRRHLELVGPVVQAALADADVTLGDLSAIAVTAGPGLVGALLVGVSAAKAYAYGAGKPLVAVDHLHGHIASLFLGPDPIRPPFLCLLASGGHTLLLEVLDHRTYVVLGRSLDDAAGEAFDKGARLLGLGYPGGAAIDALARTGDGSRAAFTVPMAGRDGLDLSFSGLKTALATRLSARPPTSDADRADLAAAYQTAIVESLAARLGRAIAITGHTRVGVVGGVAANSQLRARLEQLERHGGATVRVAPLAYCGDNAAMIGSAARFLDPAPFPALLAVDAYPRAVLQLPSG
jgi:N6-L-threonylcarbamoyladenine synthase